MAFLIIIIQSNCIGIDWSRKLQSSHNDFVDDALIQLIPFVHNAFSQLMDVIDFALVRPFL